MLDSLQVKDERKDDMTKLYKLTKTDKTTQNNTLWGDGITHTADGESRDLCNGHWIHAYRDPIVAVMLAPAHTYDCKYLMWKCEGVVGLDHADKCGCTSLTTLRQIETPNVTIEQRREFARLVALEVYPLWEKYDTDGIVGRWLNGDKTISAADAWAAASAAAAALAAASAASAASAAAAAAGATAGATRGAASA